MPGESIGRAATAATLFEVLIVVDNLSVATLVKNYLERESCHVAVVGSVASMRTVLDRSAIDLVILDVAMSDAEWWTALRWLREHTSVPVVMLTDHGETVDQLVGLELGGGDYAARPIALTELLARRRGTQHRGTPPDVETVMWFAEWHLDLSSQLLKSESGAIVHLTQAEYRILVLLASNPRQVVTRRQLTDVAAGRDWVPPDRSIDVHVSNLRRKLDPDLSVPSLIRTVRGSGYMFAPSRGV